MWESEVTRTWPDTLATDTETPYNTFQLPIYHDYHIVYIIFQFHSIMNWIIILCVTFHLKVLATPRKLQVCWFRGKVIERSQLHFHTVNHSHLFFISRVAMCHRVMWEQEQTLRATDCNALCNMHYGNGRIRWLRTKAEWNNAWTWNNGRSYD